MNASPEPIDPAPAKDSGAEDGRTMALLQKIQSGAITPKSISVSDRRQLVGVLMADGYSTADMAQILKVSDRSIERDKQAIRRSHAIARDPELTPQMVGRLGAEAELTVQRIRKAIRDKKVPAAVKVDGEHRCYQVISDLTQSLQRLGYLPTAAQKLEADLTHHIGEAPDFEELQAETRRLIHITQLALPGAQEGETADPEVAKRLTKLEEEITRANLASEIEELSSTIDPEGIARVDAEGVSDEEA